MQANRVLETMLRALTDERSLRRFFELCWRYGRSTGEAERPLRRSYWQSFTGFALALSGVGLGLWLGYGEGHLGLVIATVASSAFWYILVALITYFMLGLFRREDGRFLAGLGLPNVLTIARLLTVPIFFHLIAFYDEIPDLHVPLFGVYVFAAMSDVLDGYLARSLGLTSVFGRVIDPVSDMVFNAMTALALAFAGALHWTFVLLVWLRYFTPLFGGYFLFLYKRPFHIYATFIGKLSGFVLGLVLASSLYERLFPGAVPSWLESALVISASALMTVNVLWVVYKGVTSFRGPPKST